MILAIESAGDRGAVIVNITHDSRLLVGFGWHAHEVLCGELLSVSVFRGFLLGHLISGGVVLGDLLLSAGLLVRFEVRLLAFAVAVGDGFAVVAGLEGFVGGVGFVAVGACVGSHIDAMETRRGFAGSVDVV
jgi:hypothetical protein